MCVLISLTCIVAPTKVSTDALSNKTAIAFTAFTINHFFVFLRNIGNICLDFLMCIKFKTFTDLISNSSAIQPGFPPGLPPSGRPPPGLPPSGRAQSGRPPSVRPHFQDVLPQDVLPHGYLPQVLHLQVFQPQDEALRVDSQGMPFAPLPIQVVCTRGVLHDLGIRGG
mmetsp:Transcript_12342/g.18963  ORF Transcript_12342/g.18963 Transcript_12342/m.18963 type:complete len:168 (+) Transcript_12342:38-541(+)